jgi:very-short-patch-repair endonuclease
MKYMSFETSYHQFLNHHLSSQKGESLRRLRDGHGYAEKLFLEKVWWPAFRNFDFLFPEYTIMDMRYGSYFLDFAYLPDTFPLQLAIEIDGYGPHVQQLDRRQFTDQLNRQNFLVAMDWKVLRFSVDEIKENASRCIQYLQLLFGKYYGMNESTNKAALIEREILRLCIRLGRPFAVKDITNHFMISPNTAQGLLRGMASKDWIHPTMKNALRVRTYQLNRDKIIQLLQ